MAVKHFKQSKKNEDQGIVIETKKNTFFKDKNITLDNQTKPKPKRLLLWLGVGLLILCLPLVMAVSIYLWYDSGFKKTGQTSIFDVAKQVKTGWESNPFESKTKVNILVAGIDEIQNQREGSMLTDTLMVVSINQSGRINLLSIPRDLWIESLKTKINALYYYGEESEETTGEELMESVVEEVTGLTIDKTMMLNLDSVKKVVDALGGVNIHVRRSFVDSKFPRSDVDITMSDPNLLYETVSFNQGLQHFDGEMAIKYMRSRQSEDEIEGSDEARRERQQLVVMSLINALKEPVNYTDPEVMGRLYSLWLDNFSQTISFEELAGIVLHLESYDLSIRSVQVPIEDEESGARGVFRVNKVNGYKQWVYEPVDPSWEELRKFVAGEMEE